MEKDEDLYLKANQELKSKNKNQALWIKALTLCKGDKEAAKYEYINLRVDDLKNTKSSKAESKISYKSTQFNDMTSSVESSSTDISENLTKPSKIQYIQAWLIAAITSNLLSYLITSYMQMNITTEEELSSFYIYSPFISSIISLLVWIGVVSLDYYKNLNITKLVFWISTIGGLGTIGNLYKTQMLVKLSGDIIPNNFYLCTIIGFIAFVFAFYIWGEKEKRTTKIIFLDS